MKQTEEFERLKWRYFISQKVEEISLFFIIAVPGLFIPFYVGNTVAIRPVISIVDHILIWILGVIVLILGAGILTFIAKIFYDWFKSNMRKAEKKARRDLRR